MSALKNIIFDLGGVLINIDYSRTSQKFHELGFDDFEKMYSQFTADGLFTKLETGNISEEDFYHDVITAQFGLTEQREKENKEGIEIKGEGNISPEKIKEAWNRMLLSWRKESLNFLEILGAKYNLFLLSNTNAIHSAEFHRSLKAETGRDNIAGLFTKAYYSHLVNLRKPNADIFEFILKDAGILAGVTLFIDDSENNIKTAANLGFKTHLLLPDEKIEDLDYNLF